MTNANTIRYDNKIFRRNIVHNRLIVLTISGFPSTKIQTLNSKLYYAFLANMNKIFVNIYCENAAQCLV